MIAFWTCSCGKANTPGVKTCKCGNAKPALGVLPDPKPARTPAKPTARKETAKKRKPHKSRDPLIGTEEQLYVSTLLTNDGKTAEDLRRERENSK